MRRLTKYFLIIISFIFFSVSTPQQKHEGLMPIDKMPWQTGFSTPWVDSVFASLSPDQRIAQLLMLGIYQHGPENIQRIERLVKDYKPGGVIFFRSGPMRQVNATNLLQSAAKTPLLVAMDAEWGPAMRLDSVTAFPHHLTLGAIPGENLIYQMAFEAGNQLRRLGVHISFAPVLDVNNNPGNPVINFRSFGENRHNVTQKGLAYMRGLQDAGIITSAKHFPGHGDTHLDSHHTLPRLEQSREELDSIHIYPFAQLIKNGLHGVMIGHLEIPALETDPNRAASVSENVIEGLLRKELGFKGLVMTDALDMRGVSDFFKPGELELQALKAGNDLLLIPADLPLAIRTIRNALESGEISQDMIDSRVKKVLFYKQMVGLNKYQPITTNNLLSDLNTRRIDGLNQTLAKAAMTLVRNEDEIIPVRDIAEKKIAVLSFGANTGNPFQNMLGNYAKVEMFSLNKTHTPAQTEQMLRSLSGFDLVIIGLHRNSNSPNSNFGISRANIDLITSLANRQNLILSLFANPYSLISFGQDALKIKGIVVAYQDGKYFEEAAAQLIMGGIAARGRLPVSAPPYFPVYKGLNTLDNFRVQFAKPEEAGIKAEHLAAVDSIAQMGIDSMAYPGCQIAVIKDGMLIYHKAFGHHTYEKTRPVALNDVYDLASVTKVAATTASVMKLVDQGLIDVHKNIGDYLPFLAGTNKEKIGLRDLLAHQARLRAWISFQQRTMENGKLRQDLFKKEYSDEFSLQISDKLFLSHSYRDSIFNQIAESPLLRRRSYVYSDLGFMMLAELIYQLSGMPVDQFASKNFYEPMGLNSITFNPLKGQTINNIVPTENDTIFRKQLIWGFVHDPAAAMLNGVAGHAGLFSNSLDMAVFMQMLLNGGNYAGRQYLNAATIREFTRVQFAGNKNRRGLGFDKPAINSDNGSPACQAASPLSYGHGGFTGTYVWVDPTENLVFVFLSNRTYPYASNRKLISMEIRQKIHQAIYDAIKESRPKELS